MPAPKLKIFNDSEMLTDEAALAEETTQPVVTEEAQQQQTQAEIDAAKVDQQQPPVATDEDAAPKKGPVERAVYENVQVALKAEREQRKALEKQAQEDREFRVRAEERTKFVEEAATRIRQTAEQQKKAAERPDPDIDPDGADRYDTKQALAQERAAREAMEQRFNQFSQTYQQTEEQKQMSDWVQHTANGYAQTDPEYFDIAKKFASGRIGFWQHAGPLAPPQACHDMIEAESKLLAAWSRQYGGNFAATLAKFGREGFVAREAPPQQQQNGNGQIPRAVNGNGAAAQQRLDQVAAGQRLQGISAIPGAGQEGAGRYANYSQADLANMPEGEWARVKSDPRAAMELAVALGKAEGVSTEEAYKILKAG
jgi:hypothetical protein